MADWQKIKTEYITTDTSYRKLAEKHGVRYATIQARAQKEDWITLRDQHRTTIVSKTVSKIGDKQADRLARIYGITDKLLNKLEKAVEELDIQFAKVTHKEKIIEYNNPVRQDKPTKEIVHETEEIAEIHTIIDRLGLKQIASALKDIEEVQMIRSDADMREQEARIANLRKQVEKEENQNRDVTITIAGGDPSWQS